MADEGIDNGAGGLPAENQDGDIEIGGLVIAAILRGNPQASLRHVIVKLRGTVWGNIASMIGGSTNGSSADKLMAACAGVRFRGLSEDESRRHVLAIVARSEALVDGWLSQDTEFMRRNSMPRKTLEEVSGMFDDTEWLWDRWVPRGHLSMLVGRPGAGKSYIAAWLATNAILGGKFPDGQDSELDREQSECMWIDTESSQQIMLARLKVMAGPRKRFFWPLDPKNAGEPFPSVNLADPHWAGIVFDMAIAARPAWIVVDSLRGSHASEENSSDMQTILAASAAVARDVNCGFTFVHHLRKQAPGESNEVTLDMVRGSSAIVAVPRVVIAIDRPDPLRPEARMRVIKSNLAEMPDPVGISIDERGPMVIGDVPAVPRRITATDKAKEFLLARLRLGPAPMTELVQDGEGQGISLRSLRRACDDLGIVATKTQGGTRYWQWSLPAREGQVPF